MCKVFVIALLIKPNDIKNLKASYAFSDSLHECTTIELFSSSYCFVVLLKLHKSYNLISQLVVSVQSMSGCDLVVCSSGSRGNSFCFYLNTVLDNLQ